MDFKQVIKACLDFSTDNNGTIQSYPGGCPDQLDIRSRTNTHTEIHVKKVDAGVWKAELRQTGARKTVSRGTSETILTEEDLLEYLSHYWDGECLTERVHTTPP
jgi:hypothetical protein